MFIRNIFVKDKDFEKIVERKSDFVLNVEVKIVKLRSKSFVDVESVESRGEVNELFKVFKRMFFRREVVFFVEIFGKIVVELVKEVKEVNVSGVVIFELKIVKVLVKIE